MITTSQILKIFHKYVGADRDRQEFLGYIISLLMEEPRTEEDKKLDENDQYYPYMTISSLNAARKIYSGVKNRDISAKTAGFICNHFDKSKLVDAISSVSFDMKEGLPNELQSLGITCDWENISEVSAELFYLLLKKRIDGKSGLDSEDIASICIPSANKQIYEEKYWVELSAEANNKCTMPGCSNLLLIRTDGKAKMGCRIIKVHQSERPIFDNLLAVCPMCFEKVELVRSAEYEQKLEKIKNALTRNFAANEVLASSNFDEKIERIVRKLGNIDENKLVQLNVKPIAIKNKIESSNMLLRQKISMYVTACYYYIMDLFKQAEQENQINHTRVCRKIREKYLDFVDKGDYSQNEIFDAFVNWLQELTKEERSGCEAVIAYFVQNCEVFDEISQ